MGRKIGRNTTVALATPAMSCVTRAVTDPGCPSGGDGSEPPHAVHRRIVANLDREAT